MRRAWHRVFGHGRHQFYEVRWMELHITACKCGYSPCVVPEAQTKAGGS